jgi:hypothetical protein
MHIVSATIGLPPLRQQLLQLAHRHGGHAGEHASEVGLRIEAMAFGTGDKAVERGGSLGCDVMSGEEPVLCADAHPPQCAFGGVVVDVDVALRCADAQRVPLVEHLADGLGHGAAGQGQLLLGVKPSLDRTQQTEADGTVTTWSYDNTYQLAREQRSGDDGFDIQYAYDAAGNRTLLTQGTSVTTSVYNDANRITTATTGSAVTYSHDAAGNRGVVLLRLWAEACESGRRAALHETGHRLPRTSSALLTSPSRGMLLSRGRRG